MESASPEPSRRRATTRATGAAAQGQAAPDDGPGRPHAADGTAATGAHRVAVIDDQQPPVDSDRMVCLARHVLRRLDVPTELELSVTCVDPGPMRELNEQHMGATGPTDVLAFPIDGVDEVTPGVPGLLGDVVLCPRIAAAQAGEHGRTTVSEVDLLLVHGVLHLLGHDHADVDERTRMFSLTEELLASFAGRDPA